MSGWQPEELLQYLVHFAGVSSQVSNNFLVLEAMKMQNDITAPGAGTITQVFVSAGDTVMTGDQLISIE